MLDGRSRGEMRGPWRVMTRLWTRFCNSRTLPGQRYWASMSSVMSMKASFLRYLVVYWRRKSSASTRTSSGRSRRGGMRTVPTLRR